MNPAHKHTTAFQKQDGSSLPGRGPGFGEAEAGLGVGMARRNRANTSPALKYTPGKV